MEIWAGSKRLFALLVRGVVVCLKQRKANMKLAHNIMKHITYASARSATIGVLETNAYKTSFQKFYEVKSIKRHMLILNYIIVLYIVYAMTIKR